MGLEGWAKVGLVAGAGFWIVTGHLALIGLCTLVGVMIGLADRAS